MGIRYKFITLFTVYIHAAVSLAQGAELEIPLGDKTTTQSSTTFQGVPNRAVDGNTDGNWDMGSCTHTRGGEPGGWWMVDLEKTYSIDKVAIYNRIDPAFKDRLDGAIVRIGDDQNRNNPICGTVTSEQIENSQEIILPCDMLIGQYVSIELSSSVTLTLCEVKLYGNEYYKTTIELTSISTERTPTTELSASMSYPDRELRELADVDVTAGNVFEVARNLSVLVGRYVEIDDGYLEYISSILTDIVAIKNPSLDVTEAVVDTVDSIIESYLVS